MDIEAIETQLNSYGEQIILWAREGNFNGSFTQEWPLTQFSTAVFIVAGYLAFVLFGSVRFLMLFLFLPSFFSFFLHLLCSPFALFISFPLGVDEGYFL